MYLQCCIAGRWLRLVAQQTAGGFLEVLFGSHLHIAAIEAQQDILGHCPGCVHR
jgi:hypothetical protein